MGAELIWERELGRIEIKRGDNSLAFLLGSPIVLYRGNHVGRLSKPPRLLRGEILVPEETLRLIFRELSQPGESWVVREGLPEDTRPRTIPRPHPRRTQSISVVFIDPGHGGRDPGAMDHGIRESRLVMGISRMVVKELQRTLPDIRVVLTRSGNNTVELDERARHANRYLKLGHKGVFVSIHANASLSRSRYGFETYYLSPIASNADSRATASMENGALDLDIKEKQGKTIDTILSKMLVERFRRESIMLAHRIQSGLDRLIGRHSRDRGVRRANFFVMRRVFMPSVLVEIGFITHRREASLLKSASHQRRIARGIATGIRNFVQMAGKKK